MKDDFDSIVDDMTTLSDSISSVSVKSGKNSRSDIFAYGYRFDSKEELDIYEWIAEAKELGFIDSFEYQPKSFELFEGHKNSKGKYDIRPHVYTADFKVVFNDKWFDFRIKNKLKVFDKFDEKTIYIDVKGQYNKFGGDERYLSVNSKWCFAKYGVFIWKVIPLPFFEKTWLPEKCVLTRKTKKVSSKYKNVRTFAHHDFIIQH